MLNGIESPTSPDYRMSLNVNQDQNGVKMASKTLFFRTFCVIQAFVLTALTTIAPWLPDTNSQQLANAGSGKIRFLEYDWGLNDQK